jgi:hypothetical protein
VFEENPANLAAGEANEEPMAARAAGTPAPRDEGISSQGSERATPVIGGGETAPSAARAVAVALAGWLMPGLGHALLKMWGRALAIFLTVGFLVYLGAGMRGNVFEPGGEDAFARLGYVADAGTGSFYFVARALEISGSDVSHADGDYGTRFLATAGVLNLLAALHAYEAARGRKA